MHALIVEDDMVCRRILQKLLSAYGSVDAVTNGREALTAIQKARAAQTPYHLICLDIDMPDMNGHQVLIQIRKEEDSLGGVPDARARVLMTTGHSQPEHVVVAFHNRCDGFLVKPVNPHKLSEKLHVFGFAPLSDGNYEPGPSPTAPR
jgi:two-component system chemotaxis response regulator CheY